MSWEFFKSLFTAENFWGIKPYPEPEVDLSKKETYLCCGNCELFQRGGAKTERNRKGFCDIIYWQYDLNFIRSRWYCVKFELAKRLRENYRVVKGSRNPDMCIIEQLRQAGRGKVPGLRSSDVYIS